MAPELANAATSGRNVIENWAMRHKSPALDCEDESGRSRVYNLAQHVLPQFIVDMLPKSSYGSDCEELIKDIAALNPRSVLNRYAESATLSALADLRLSEQPSARFPTRSRPANNWPATTNSMQSLLVLQATPSRLVPTTRVQFANPPVQPTPAAHPCAQSTATATSLCDSQTSPGTPRTASIPTTHATPVPCVANSPLFPVKPTRATPYPLSCRV